MTTLADWPHLDETIQRFRELGKAIVRLPSPYALQEPSFGDGSSEADLERLRLVAGVADLPPDLRVFLARYAPMRAMDLFNGYSLYDARRCADLALSHPIPSVVRRADSVIGVIPVGGDGGGNQFLLSVSCEQVGRVWKWSHEAMVDDDRTLDVDALGWGLSVVGDSFTDLLSRFAKDWAAFLRNDVAWDYLSG